MPVDSKKSVLKTVNQRKYLNKDLDGFKADLLEYTKVYFSDKIRDFSEPGVGSMFLGLAAFVGDSMSFYLDHQFQELDPLTAIEPKNVQRLLRTAGVKIVGASPAVVNVTFSINVPADTSNRQQPLASSLPVINEGTVVTANNGVAFELVEPLDFSKRNSSTGKLVATVKNIQTNTQNQPENYILSLTGICISGARSTETFSVGSFVPFQRFTLANKNVTDIISVRDNLGNIYYEVDYLTQDTVFKGILNKNDDGELVKENLQVLPAPYRFVRDTDVQTELTTLIFGGGSAETLQEDIVPDPSDFAVPLYGKSTFPRFSLDPGNLLQTNTLGIVAPNSVITITYRYGGGLKHNVSSLSVRNVSTLLMSFPNSPSNTIAARVRAQLDVVNEDNAAGGEDTPTLNDLKTKIASARNAQNRIVTREDLLARIYTMPSNFGRVFRAGVRSNPNNPLATRLFIISRNSDGTLAISPDSLKNNLVTYLNSYRMISDAIDILDAQIINITVEFVITVDLAYNKALVTQNVISKLIEYFNIKNYEIDQPIIVADLTNIVYNNEGVLSVDSIQVRNINGSVGTRNYSNNFFDVDANTTKGIIIPPPGGIFEIRFPDFDIIGNVI